MKDIRLKIRAYNNRLVSLREAAGIATCTEMAIKLGMSLGTYCQYEAMSIFPMDGKGKWRPNAEKIAEFHKCLPEDIFPAFTHQVKARPVELEINASDIPALQDAGFMKALPSPYDRAEANELSEAVKVSLSKLTPREEKILQMRMGLDG